MAGVVLGVAAIAGGTSGMGVRMGVGMPAEGDVPDVRDDDRMAAPAVFERPAPDSIEVLRDMERHVTLLVRRVSPAVVGVLVGGATGSGVVVSPDGLVLSAAHVCGEPGREVVFQFSDGSTARGRTLGTYHAMDAGLMKIEDAAGRPWVGMGDRPAPRSGQWVLGLGHPGGFDPARPAVVRLGRLLEVDGDLLRTDCTLSGGDSGGPLFDMEGRVIGIHSRISESTDENFHAPIQAYRGAWERLLSGDNWGTDPGAPRTWVGVRGSDGPRGCRVDWVEENGPAARAGVRVGDLVREMNGREVRDFAGFREAVGEAEPGAVLVWRIERDGEEQVVEVQAASRRRRW